MVATQLSLYKGALRFAEERSIATTSDDVEQRYVLDEIWNDGFIDKVLEMGLWKFAFRTAQLDAVDPYTDPLSAGWQQFTLPTDLIKIARVCTDPGFTEPCLDYYSEGDYLYSYQSILYIQYVSNDAAYGADYDLWPGSFETFVQAQLGYWALPRLSGSESKQERLGNELHKLKTRARSECAMRDPTKFPPETGWNRSRRGWRGMRSSRDYSGL